EQSGLQTHIATTESVSLRLRRIGLTGWRDFCQTRRRYADLESGGGLSPARFFACSRPAVPKINHSGKRKGRTVNPLIQLKTTPPLLITITLLCFALLPRAQAVVPAPDGGYPGANTAEGKDALLNLTSGIGDTAVGHKALLHNTTGSYNVGIGA